MAKPHMSEDYEERVTVVPPDPSGMASALERNIQALRERERQEAKSVSRQTRVADAITFFSGSMLFVYLHLALFGAWIVLNLGMLPAIKPFDPNFIILATWASVEAIFLSTFVLISQNRTAAEADKRAKLDLQVSLLAEHEVTRLVRLTAAIADRIGIAEAKDPELDELERDVAPEAVLDVLDDEGSPPDTRQE